MQYFKDSSKLLKDIYFQQHCGKRIIPSLFIDLCISFLGIYRKKVFYKVPQIWWLKSREMYSLITLGATIIYSEEESFLSSFQLLVVAGSPWHSLASSAYIAVSFQFQPLFSHILLPSVCVCLHRSLFFSGFCLFVCF